MWWNQTEKLKPPWWPVISIFVMLVLWTIELFLGWDFRLALEILMAGVTLHCLFLAIRTIDFRYFIWVLFLLNLVLGNLASKYHFKTLESIINVTSFPVSFLLIFQLIMYPIRNYFIQILELSAQPVEEEMDGFTARPYPAGILKYSREEIIGYAKFLRRKLIAFPYMEANRVILVIKNSFFMLMVRDLYYKPDFTRDTYVVFDFEGNISVHIGKRDYDKFKWELTFDQLCESMDNLFKLFLHYYQNGEKENIIRTLKGKLPVPYKLHSHPSEKSKEPDETSIK